MADQTAGSAFANFLEAELTAENSRQDSLERRGLALVSVAGTLTTVLFSVRAALAPAPRTASGMTTGLLVAALAALVVTAGCASATNAPRRVRLVDPDGLLTAAAERWERVEDDAKRMLFATRAEQLRASQNANDQRGVLLLASLVGLALAVLALSAAVALMAA